MHAVDAEHAPEVSYCSAGVGDGQTPSIPVYGKFIIRSDVMYVRTPALLTSPKDEAAYALYREGESMAEDGRVAESIAAFRRAFRMSPALQEALGQ